MAGQANDARGPGLQHRKLRAIAQPQFFQPVDLVRHAKKPVHATSLAGTHQGERYNVFQGKLFRFGAATQQKIIETKSHLFLYSTND